MDSTRELYWNVGHGYIPLMYLLAFASIAYLAWGFARRLKIWKRGGPLDRFDRPFARFARMIGINATQRLVARTAPGLLHALWFWGFGLLFLGTLIVMAQADFFTPLLGRTFLRGGFYRWFSLVLDLAGAVALIALVGLFIRRFALRPVGLETRLQDWLAHFLLLLIIATGFIIEGLRIASTELGPDPALAAWSPVGRRVAILLATMDPGTLIPLHRGLWWFHFALTLAFIVAIPSSKLRHIFTTAANAWFAPLEAKGHIETLDLEDEKATQFGVAKVSDLTWKDIFDADACTSCARCQDACPAWATGKPLSPMKIVHQIGEAAEASTGTGADTDPALCDLVGTDAIWACTACRACQELCPAGIEQVNKILGMRRNLTLMEGSFPDEGVRAATTGIEVNGNPFGLGFASRADWAAGLELVDAASGEDFDLLYFVGCYASFDARNKKIARSFVEICKKAELRVAILGAREKCCGEPIRKLGNEYLYQAIARENIEAIKAAGTKRIVTTCPHCWNTLGRDYRDLGLDLLVEHHSSFIEALMSSGRLFLEPDAFEYCYHDSCNVGRYRDSYREPRRALELAGGRIVEMRMHGAKGFCCGGGGGRILAEENIGTRIASTRVAMAHETGAPLLASNCPFCLSMFEDGKKAAGLEGRLELRDLAEIVAERLGPRTGRKR